MRFDLVDLQLFLGERLVERGVEGIDEKERTQLRRSGLPFRRVTESRLF